ncbi:CBS domain-containing protein [Halorubrum aquaticum]|uniref:CBS domain-containing protein n=1 Tax=Halorubrum aquaticum TaxID=387340 RepID=A0A1I3BH00_9EURY|nr:CBS domain-containing protein [Halorubrum aquaticum]SFH61420.1 CBS domain-containing protein [Halorubrum aquaticum]
MGDVPVGRLMSTDLVTVAADATAAEAAERMGETGVNSILVVDESGRLEGLLTGWDFVRLVRENDPHDETLVRECMTTAVVTASRDDSVDALADLADGEYSHLPVTDDDGVVVGMLSTTDLTEYLAGR